MATKAESVVVSVYVETPRRKRRVVSSSTPNGHFHHKVGVGCNRRAELLLYSQQLREVARSQSVGPTPAHHSQSTTNHPQHSTKIITVRYTRKHLGTPTCLGNWKKVWNPRFLKSLGGHRGKKEKKKKQHSRSATNKMSAIIKRLDVQKKWGFLTQFFSTLHKRS